MYTIMLQALLYQDPKRWSFTFNLYAQLTRVQMHQCPHVSMPFVKPGMTYFYTYM